MRNYGVQNAEGGVQVAPVMTWETGYSRHKRKDKCRGESLFQIEREKFLFLHREHSCVNVAVMAQVFLT